MPPGTGHIFGATTVSVANLEGAEPALPPPLGDGMTPSLTVMLANAKF